MTPMTPPTETGEQASTVENGSAHISNQLSKLSIKEHALNKADPLPPIPTVQNDSSDMISSPSSSQSQGGTSSPSNNPSAAKSPKDTSRRVSPTFKKGVKDFTFGETLGEGSYSTVVAATDNITGHHYAIKILDKRHIIKEKKVKYVNIEKDTLNKLNHPGIVRLFFTFQDEMSLYFVLDLAKNGELLTYIKKLGAFDDYSTRYYAAQVLSTIEYMHSQGVIHRDLKPENILLDEQMRIKITDFGTAKILDTNENGETRDAANSFVGTAEYVSPELLTEKSACKSSDLWALGCIIYQLLAGRPPFKGSNEYQTFQKIVKLEYSFPDGFPPKAEDLVKKLLVLNPNERLGAGPGGIAQLRGHPFFDGIDWETIWTIPGPKLLPYLPSVPNHNLEALRTPSESYLPGIPMVSNNSSQTAFTPTASTPGLIEKRDPFGLSDEGIRPNASMEEKLAAQHLSDSPWLPFLLKNELILHEGYVIRRKGLFAKKRMLILTNFPRMVYIDADKMQQKGEIFWSSRITVELKGKKHFFVHTPHKTYYFEEPNGDARGWVDLIRSVQARDAE